MPTQHVEEFDPALCSPAPGNRAVGPADLADLLPTMGDPRIGQKQPGIVYDDPEEAGRLRVAAGNRRCAACRFLGIKFKAVRVPGPVTPLDVINIRLTENVLRKEMTPLEIAADIEQYMKLTGATQEEAAERWKRSPGWVSKHLSLKNLIPELHPLVEGGKLCGDVARIIASLPTPEQQKELAERVVKSDMKRDAVERIAAGMKGKKVSGKPKDRKINHDGACIVAPGDWSSGRLLEWASGLVKKFRQEAV